MFLTKMSKNLHMSFAAMRHLAEGLCTARAESRKLFYVPCGHTYTNSVHYGMTINVALENINKK
jgi:hypothetical protein